MSLAIQGRFIGLIGSEIVQVVYSDESGIGDKKQSIAVVTAIILNMDSQWEPIERDLSAIKAFFIPPKLLHRLGKFPSMVAFGEGSELKGDLLFKGLRGKIQGVKPQEASEALIHVLSVAVKNSVQIFHGAIDRAGRAEWNRKHLRKSLQIQTDPEAAFDECLRRLDAFVHTFMPKERVLWIADRTGFEKSRKRGLKGFQFIQGTVSLRVLLENYANKGLADLGLRLNDARPSHVIDTIYFGSSHESLALQLADVCCTTIAQHLLKRPDAEPFYNLIRRQVITDGTLVIYSDAWSGLSGKEKA